MHEFDKLLLEGSPTIDVAKVHALFTDDMLDGAADAMTKTKPEARKFIEPFLKPLFHVTNSGHDVHYDYRNGMRIMIKPAFDVELRLFDARNRSRPVTVAKLEMGKTYYYEAPYKYFVPWEVTIGDLYIPFDLWGKDVLISYRAPTVGDAMYWLAHVNEFKEMTGCKLTVAATNAAIALYQKIYPDINWVTHEYALENHDHWQAIYRLGVFAQANSPYQVIGYRQNNLITHAQMILGIPLRLSPPDLTSLNLQPTADLPKDYIVIAPQGSGAKKTWSMPYWQELCDVLVSRGINVVAVGDGPIPTGIINRSGRHPLETTLSIIKYAKAFIGGPSGCYAMAWFVDTPRVIISGFTNATVEAPTPYRAYPVQGCMDCWGCLYAPLIKTDLDCPHAELPPDFPGEVVRPLQVHECLLNVTPLMVLNQLKQLYIDKEYPW